MTWVAWACGVPVVAARATGAMDLVVEGETGFLVPPRDVTAYADAIERLARDPALRRSAGEAGHVRMQAHVWPQVNQAVLDAYLEVMAAR